MWGVHARLLLQTSYCSVCYILFAFELQEILKQFGGGKIKIAVCKTSALKYLMQASVVLK